MNRSARNGAVATLAAGAVIALLAMPAPAAAQARVQAQLCTQNVEPVCAVTPQGAHFTYPNACVARQAGAKVLHGGLCYGPICLTIQDPVCARPPKGPPRTYGNLCLAEQANAVYLRKGSCR